jgi:hypothetical protein
MTPNPSCKPQQIDCELFWSDAEIKSHFVLLYQREDLAAEILKAAQDNGCATIIVGHKSSPWLREQFHAHTAVQLKSASPDVTVCAVNV